MDIYAPKNVIAQADTVEKVWKLIADMADNPNGYSDAATLANIRAYAALATGK